jgi:dTDP-4-dehydrorhamnose 3,5-epimerase-like enzyme
MTKPSEIRDHERSIKEINKQNRGFFFKFVKKKEIKNHGLKKIVCKTFHEI